MSPIFVRPQRVWPKLSSIWGIRVNLVSIVSLRPPKNYCPDIHTVYLSHKFHAKNREKGRKLKEKNCTNKRNQQ